MLRIAYGAKRVNNHFGMRRAERPNIYWPFVKEEVEKVIARLRVVWVERLSWDRCLDSYDGAKTFFYIDPPYRCDGAKAYRHFFTDEDHAKLADRLLSAKGRWLVSYNDDEFIRRLYRRRGVQVEGIGVRYGIQGGFWKQAGELLIRIIEGARNAAWR